MTQAEIMQVIRETASAYGVRTAYLFGSFARGTAGAASDIDICVEFDGPTTMLAFVGFKLALERRLGRRVDLVTRRSVHPGMRESIESEWIRVA
jgi:predicted nucleotidyltransferase